MKQALTFVANRDIQALANNKGGLNGEEHYSDFEEHVFEDVDNGFIFHFLTCAPPELGAMGRVECRTE